MLRRQVSLSLTYIACLFCCFVQAQAQQAVVPYRYDTRNGYAANFRYYDDTYNGTGNPAVAGSPLSGGIGQLTDGFVGGANYRDNLGNGEAYEWVGWDTTPAGGGSVNIKFFFDSSIQFDNIALHMVQNQDGIVLPNTIRLTFSNDGVNFGQEVIYTTTATQRSASTAQWITIPLPRTAQFVNLNFSDGYPFVSEVRFAKARSSIGGVIALQGTQNAAQTLQFTFRPTTGSAFTRTATLNFAGGYTISDLPYDLYTVSIKGAKWLRRNITVDTRAGNITNANATLLAGDANNDNFADISDLLILIGHYNQAAPASGFLDAADFNCDGINDIADLLLLIGNYNKQGDS